MTSRKHKKVLLTPEQFYQIRDEYQARKHIMTAEFDAVMDTLEYLIDRGISPLISVSQVKEK